MSRKEVLSSNEKFTFIYGVDHVLSVFVLITDNTLDEDTEVVLSADNLGVVKCDNFDQQYPFAATVVKELENAFEIARKRCNQYPNIDANRVFNLAQCFGVVITKSDVYRDLD